MSDFYNRQGKPMELMEWAKSFEDWDNKVVANDKLNGVMVSTVWLGLDHQISDVGPPLIFETMIFGGKHDQEQWRYSTEQEALAGHAVAVALVESDA